MEPVKLRVIGSVIGLDPADPDPDPVDPLGGVLSDELGGVLSDELGQEYALGTVNLDRISVDAIDVATLAHGNGFEDGAGLGGEDERGRDCGDGAGVGLAPRAGEAGDGDGIGKLFGAGAGSGRTSGNGIGAGMYTSSGSGRW